MIKKIIRTAIPIIAFSMLLFFSVSAYVRYSRRYRKVYVASHQLSQRSKISAEDLVEMEVPKEFLTDDVYVNKQDIIGKYVRLSHTIPKGSLIYRMALESDIKDLAATLLMPGQVNYDLFVNEIKINTGSIAENMYVDLYLTINGKQRSFSDLLIGDCRITGLYDYNGKRVRDFDTDQRIQIVSIAVGKDDIGILNMAMLSGEISVLVSKEPYQVNSFSKLNSGSELFELIQ